MTDFLGWAAEADLLDQRAALLEAQADDRYDRAARWYGGGSYAFVKSLDTADDYKKQARALREQAQTYRTLARAGGKG
ncbi:MAG: hypothetical protein QM809_10210 [Gordonia sp. (in: high G+C Gram-positive bacteria)]|uniref:hypothetical protein n=1 Tax=Gordonia sp. (in: high G+C Gram-positive bacteria) TaxID=84139 RepID=UPI0039E323D2